MYVVLILPIILDSYGITRSSTYTCSIYTCILYVLLYVGVYMHIVYVG
jgi:hypothetical protein